MEINVFGGRAQELLEREREITRTSGRGKDLFFACRLAGQRCLVLDLVFELVAGVESHHPPRRNRDGFTGTRIATRTRFFGTDLEIAEASNLDVGARNQLLHHELKESVHHVFGLALVQADVLVQKLGQVRLGQGRGFEAVNGYFHGGQCESEWRL